MASEALRSARRVAVSSAKRAEKRGEAAARPRLCDAAERLVEAELWPFPKYAELLFHHQTGAPEEY